MVASVSLATARHCGEAEGQAPALLELLMLTTRLCEGELVIFGATGASDQIAVACRILDDEAIPWPEGLAMAAPDAIAVGRPMKFEQDLRFERWIGTFESHPLDNHRVIDFEGRRRELCVG